MCVCWCIRLFVCLAGWLVGCWLIACLFVRVVASSFVWVVRWLVGCLCAVDVVLKRPLVCVAVCSLGWLSDCLCVCLCGC